MPSKEQPNVALETSLGEFELELYWDHAPKVVILFIFYFFFFLPN
jgi:cyclophilin family peptidyl-prolyl cis-trans isomerase